MFKNNTVTLVIAALSLVFSFSQTQAQKKTAFLQLFGTVKGNGRNLDSVQLKVQENGMALQTASTKENGGFLIVLDLNKNMTLTFSKAGYISKTVEVNTIVPPEGADIGYTFKCDLELFLDIGIAKADAMTKPVAKISYITQYEDFDYDVNYSKRIKQEQLDVLKSAEEAKRQRDKVRLDSLNRIWTDSIAKAKVRDSLQNIEQAGRNKEQKDAMARAAAAAAALAASLEKSRQDSVNNALAEMKRKQEEERQRLIAESREKARQDSITRADAEAKRLAEIAKEKATRDSLANATVAAQMRQKAVADSTAKALTAEKFRKDSTVKAEAEAKRLAELAQKRTADSIANAKTAEAETKRLAELNKKKTDDSLAQAKIALAARQKAMADSSAKAEALEKRRQDSTAKATTEAERLAKINRQKEMADSTLKAETEAKRLAEVAKKKSADSIAEAKAAEGEKKRLADLFKKKTDDSITQAKIASEARAKAMAEAELLAKATRQKEINDSIATAKTQAEARKKEEADSISRAQIAMQARKKFVADSLAQATVLLQARKDSTTKANAEAKRIAEEQRRIATQDSIAKSKMDAEARRKATDDSLVAAKAAEEARLKSVAEAKEKARQDSVTQVKETARLKSEADAKARQEAAVQARQKAVDDSTAKVEAAAKLVLAQKEKAIQDEENRRKLEGERKGRDSIALAEKTQKDKAVQERNAKIQADILAQKQSLTKTYFTDTAKTAKVAGTGVPKIRESDYQEGITDEKVEESNRTIFRTVVKQEGATYNYQKIVYNYGTFYFKNESSMTQTTFDLEINNARNAFKK